MKKILALLTTLALLCSMVVCVSAAGTPTFELSSATTTAGGQAELTFSILNNPGITALQVDFTWNTQYISLSAKPTDYRLLDGAKFTPSGVLTKQPYSLNWSVDEYDAYETGEFATFVFNVAEGTPAGEYPVTVSYESYNVYSAATGNPEVTFETVNGIITVEGEAAPEYTYDKTQFNNGALEVAYDFAGSNKLVIVAYSDSGKRLEKAIFVDVDADDADTAINLAAAIGSVANATSYKAMLWVDDVNCQPLLDAIGW